MFAVIPAYNTMLFSVFLQCQLVFFQVGADGTMVSFYCLSTLFAPDPFSLGFQAAECPLVIFDGQSVILSHVDLERFLGMERACKQRYQSNRAFYELSIISIIILPAAHLENWQAYSQPENQGLVPSVGQPVSTSAAILFVGNDHFSMFSESEIKYFFKKCSLVS